MPSKTGGTFNLASARPRGPGRPPSGFGFRITVQSSAPTFFAVFTGIAETGPGAVPAAGLARRRGYTAGAIYTLLIWAAGEGFGGPYTAGTARLENRPGPRPGPAPDNVRAARPANPGR